MMKNIITMRRLGSMGRFGNQLLQYAALSTYAHAHGCEFQCPHWIGEEIFGIPHNPVTVQLPKWVEQYDKDGQPRRATGNEMVNHDVHGWFQWNTQYWVRPPFKTNLWCHGYVFTEKWSRRLFSILEQLMYDVPSRTVVGIQIRRGDYGQGSSYDAITPVSWYLAWLKKNWNALNDPVLFIATEDRNLLTPFEQCGYDPKTVESLGIELQSTPYPYYNYTSEDLKSKKPHLMDFLPEWFGLTLCDYLLAANSTFSFTAAMCSPCLKHFYRPNIAEGRFSEEDIWNCWPLRRDCK